MTIPRNLSIFAQGTFASGGVSIGNTTDPGATNLSVTGSATIQTLTVGLGGGSVGSNTVVGYQAGASNSTSTTVTAVGYQAAYANTGGLLTAFGYKALTANTSGNPNCAFGASALIANTTGSNNDAFGWNTLAANVDGSGNAAFGRQALATNISGTANVAMGYQSLYSNTAANSVAIGYQALYSNNAGGNVTGGVIGIGYTAGSTSTDGRNSVFLGYNSQPAAAADVNCFVIGTSNTTGKGNSTGFINANSGSIYQGNNSTLWAITSDARIKENVSTLENGLSTILALRPVEFDYIETKKHDVSFIAQEYQLVLPEQVTEHTASPAEKEIANTDTLLGLTPNLVPYLVKAIQELKAEFDAYKATHP